MKANSYKQYVYSFEERRCVFLTELIKMLRELNPTAEIKLQYRAGAFPAIKVDFPPEQLILPEGCKLCGPDVGDRHIVWGEKEYVVTDSDYRVT